MGEIYSAEDTQLGRTVALKILPTAVAADPDRMRRFVLEAKAASALNHPNILTVHEIGSEGDRYFIVTEFVDGITLRKKMVQKQTSLDEAINIIAQLIDALSAAHAAGIVHRDIKPENIMLRTDGYVKVLDFGLAKLLEQQEIDSDASTLIDTVPGIVLGTVSYMSPEQLRGQQVDVRTDIWSTGVVFFEMVTGKLPFTGANTLDVAASILSERPVRPSEARADLHIELSTFLSHLLEKDPERRCSSVHQVKSELEVLRRKLESSRLGSNLSTVPYVEPQLQKQSGRFAGARGAQPAVALAPTPPGIIVLPFASVGFGEGDSSIGIGLGSVITTDLAKIRNLSVISQRALDQSDLQRGNREARELAHELGATFLLEGEILREGHRLKITNRLIDVASSRVIWGGQYRGEDSDLFKIQDEVCESVASALKLNLSTTVREEIGRPATDNIEAFEFYSKGEAFLERRDIKENIDFAIQMFEEALKLDPNFSLALAGLGEAYWSKYETTRVIDWVDRAIAASDRALVLDPRQGRVHLSLGIIYHGTGNLSAAIEEFEKASEIQPLSDDSFRWLGRCYLEKGEAQRAVEYLQRAISIRPGFWDNHNRLGSCYYTLGRYQDAAEQFRKVITIQPDNHYGYDNLGGIYYLLGRYEDAVTMHRRAIEIRPSDRAYSNLGCNYFYLGRFEEAIEAYQQSLKLDPGNSINHRNLGDAYARIGRESEAKEHYKIAVDLLQKSLLVNPNDAELLSQLAVYQAKLNDSERARQSITEAVNRAPHNIQILYHKAVVHALTGQPDAAIDALNTALSQGYSPSEASRDPDFHVLQNNHKFQKLFTK